MMSRMASEWILSSCLLILAVVTLRAALGKRISARLRYALWLAVLVRLLVPVQLFTSTVVGVPELSTLHSQVPANAYTAPEGAVPPAVVPAVPDMDALPPDVTVTVDTDAVKWNDEQTHPTGVELRLEEVLTVLWVLGSAAVGTVLVASNVQFYVNLRQKRQRLAADCPLPVYVADGLPSPCLFGMIRPAVYVTPEAAGDPVMLRHVLAHELTHAKQLDHIWSFFRAAALAVHWWNPLVWLAVVLSRRDGELACDEGALERLGDGERRAYGETLLALVTAPARPGDLFSCATTMSGGKRDLQERIRCIAHRPRRLLGAAVLAVAVLVLVVLCAFGRQVEPAAADGDGQDGSGAPLVMSAGGSWQDAQIMVDENGYPHIRYADDQEWVPLGGPIAPPVEWQDPDSEEALAGRSECTALPGGDEEIWAGLVSPTDGWLVACYGHGMASADIYVYKTADGGETWTEVTKPCNTVTEQDVHTWRVSTVGFISPDTLIVACRLFDTAPCFITRDGGETWEQIPLPGEYMHVESIEVHGQLVTMNIARYEGGAAQYIMNSSDMGKTWDVSALSPLPLTPDLNRDGTPEVVRVFSDSGEEKQIATVEQDDQVLWTGEAYTPHAGWNAYFLCRQNGEDHLLQFNPYMSGGVSQYQYRLFHLDSSGREVVEQENSVEFDLLFAEDFSDMHRFDPAEIATFVAEINGFLENSTALINTDGNLQSAFQWTGKQQYTLAPLCDGDGYTWDDTKSELENLTAYRDTVEAIARGIQVSGAPTEADVLAMRAKVEKGMTEEAIDRLTEKIARANLALETEYVYSYADFFERLRDPEDLLWNLFEETGEVQTGWAYDGDLDKDAVCRREGLTDEEFYETYGTAVVKENRYAAEDFIALMRELKASVNSGLLDRDFDRLIELCEKAKAEHDVSCVLEMYYMLHDMDYFLLRYWATDMAPLVQDQSTISKYYGSLSIWNGN